MSQHTASIRWQREGAFARKQYQRAHRWVFDGGVEVPAAASPLVVPRPWTVDEAVDPEEAFVAAIASCHMLTFLFLAANAGYVAEAYVDDAAGLLAKDAEGGQAMTEVTLRPRITWAEGRAPSAEALAALHEQAHRECFISRSVKSRVRVATP
ncbi:MAG: OsmC family protein [Myxococcaceae bacterium]|jgi:organic hydroperoxide reductase OsmC/OhrA|nr:OsmC family protein [Myxococcaceae bacterium]MCA3016386.1 OsmC family protein [Myxococcaceae bacterium]